MSSITRASNAAVDTRPTLRPKALRVPRISFSSADAARLQRLAIGQQQPELLALGRLHMDRGEPADAHRLRDRTCVIAVGLDRHDCGRTLHTPGFDADRREAGGLQPLAQPGRQRPGFQAKTLDRNLGRLQPSCNRLRFSIRLALSKDDASIIDNADGSLVERYIQAHEVGHGSLR